MNKLDYGNKQSYTIDGHIHLFDEDWVIPKAQLLRKRNVGFIDIEPKKIEKYINGVPEMYDKYIEKYHDRNNILLASALTSEDMIKIHQNHPDDIHGFGEIKAYRDVTVNKVPLSRLSRYSKVMEYATEHHLPIYIHFTITSEKDIRDFESWIEGGTTVVLCHFGMDDVYDKTFSYHAVQQMLARNENLYTEATWESLEFFYANPSMLFDLPTDRILVGSDLNQKYFENHGSSSEEVRMLDEVSKYLRSDVTICKIFPEMGETKKYRI